MSPSLTLVFGGCQACLALHGPGHLNLVLIHTMPSAPPAESSPQTTCFLKSCCVNFNWRNRNQHLLTHIGHPSQKQRNDSIREFTQSNSQNWQQLMGRYTVRTNCLSQQLFIDKPSQGAGALCVPPVHCDGELMSSILYKSPSSNYSCILRNWTMATSCPEDSVPQQSLSWRIRILWTYQDILVIQLCGFDMYVPGDQGCWTHFQICTANGVSLLKTNRIKCLIISKVGLVFFFKTFFCILYLFLYC